MNTVKALGLVGLATAGLFAAQAYATTVTGCPMSPVAAAGQMQGSPVCIAPYGSDHDGTGLQSVLAGPSSPYYNGNSIFTSGAGVDPYTQQVQTPYWSVNGLTGSVSTILLQIAGYAGQDTFGIFDPTNHQNKLVLFKSGMDGDQVSLSTGPNGQYWLNFDKSTSVTFGATNKFGFFLTTPAGETFYSLPSLNEAGGTMYADGTPHMVAFAGNGDDLKPMAGLNGGPWGLNEYILAWEDLPFGSSDLDYNDFLVMVESVHPVPEPAVLGMFGLGLLAIAMAAGLRRRRSFEA